MTCTCTCLIRSLSYRLASSYAVRVTKPCRLSQTIFVARSCGMACWSIRFEQFEHVLDAPFDKVLQRRSVRVSRRSNCSLECTVVVGQDIGWPGARAVFRRRRVVACASHIMSSMYSAILKASCLNQHNTLNAGGLARL